MTIMNELTETCQDMITLLTDQRAKIIKQIPSLRDTHPEFADIEEEHVANLTYNIDSLQKFLVEFSVESSAHDDGCPVESDTCVMDTTSTLSDEKNAEVIRTGLDRLYDLI